MLDKYKGKKSYFGTVIIAIVGLGLFTYGLYKSDVYLTTHGISLVAFAYTLAAIRHAIK